MGFEMLSRTSVPNDRPETPTFEVFLMFKWLKTRLYNTDTRYPFLTRSYSLMRQTGVKACFVNFLLRPLNN